MDWIDLAQDRDQWQALVNTVMNLRLRDFLNGCWCPKKDLRIGHCYFLGGGGGPKLRSKGHVL
jgi:hypothetical protein